MFPAISSISFRTELLLKGIFRIISAADLLITMVIASFNNDKIEFSPIFCGLSDLTIDKEILYEVWSSSSSCLETAKIIFISLAELCTSYSYLESMPQLCHFSLEGSTVSFENVY